MEHREILREIGAQAVAEQGKRQSGMTCGNPLVDGKRIRQQDVPALLICEETRRPAQRPMSAVVVHNDRKSAPPGILGEVRVAPRMFAESVQDLDHRRGAGGRRKRQDPYCMAVRAEGSLRMRRASHLRFSARRSRCRPAGPASRAPATHRCRAARTAGARRPRRRARPVQPAPARAMPIAAAPRAPKRRIPPTTYEPDLTRAPRSII